MTREDESTSLLLYLLGNEGRGEHAVDVQCLNFLVGYKIQSYGDVH